MQNWLAEHPTIVNFRWSPTQLWGSTWFFLMAAISAYVTTAVALHLFLHLCRRLRPVPMGPVPALHCLLMTLISVVLFLGMFLSAASEIRDSRWLWRRTGTTPLRWFLCFPLGTRPSGRVFFWSYMFYLSRFLHLFRTLVIVLRRRKLTFFRLFNQSFLLVMSFLWLEFSQSFQVLAILLTTLLHSVVYADRFWTEIGLRSARFPFVVNCQAVLLICNLISHVGVLSLHFLTTGCNGIGAWTFNSVMNMAILLLFLKQKSGKVESPKTSRAAPDGCSRSTEASPTPKSDRKHKNS